MHKHHDYAAAEAENESSIHGPGFQAAYMCHLKLVNELLIGLWLATVPKLTQSSAVMQLCVIGACLIQ